MPLPAQRLIDLIRQAAPEETAEDWDSVGLQCGDPLRDIETAVLALDVRPETLACATREGAGLIIAHHPLIFKPLSHIDIHHFPGRELTTLLENRIALYVAHTNVDQSRLLSMNAAIGGLLPFSSYAPAAAPPQAAEMKLVTFVPVDCVDGVREALAQAGAGQIGGYSGCSFNLRGEGTFLGGEETHPARGERGRLERVEEVRLEMVCSKRNLDRVLTALWKAHPYEEVAYDLYPLAGYRTERHFLWQGELAEEMTLQGFARLVQASLGGGEAPVRFAGDPDRMVRRIAWCSGGGKGCISSLDPHEVDVFLTGDTGHHDALDCLSRGIALVDLDHHWTERLFIGNIRDYLTQHLPQGAVRLIEDPSGPVYHALA